MAPATDTVIVAYKQVRAIERGKKGIPQTFVFGSNISFPPPMAHTEIYFFALRIFFISDASDQFFFFWFFHLNLKDLVAANETGQPGQTLFPASADANQQSISSGILDDAHNSCLFFFNYFFLMVLHFVTQKPKTYNSFSGKHNHKKKKSSRAGQVKFLFFLTMCSIATSKSTKSITGLASL